ncbi:MAG: Intracellular protease, PfpI family [Mycobacterium sp.]|nr:Intracellular protease, PfpI family [Mycobacterium sp.]
MRDRNLVTSRGPQDMRAFVPAMLDVFTQASSQLLQTVPSAAGSDLQRDKPIGWAMAALRWAPKPSAAALTGVAAAALAAPLRRRVSIGGQERPRRSRTGRGMRGRFLTGVKATPMKDIMARRDHPWTST